MNFEHAAVSPPRFFIPTAMAAIEHGALHKPLHVSVAYGYRDARDLAAVFQGRAQGYAYGRQGNPTTAALEAKVNEMEDGVASVYVRDRHGGDRRDPDGAAARRRSRRGQPVSLRQHGQHVRHARCARRHIIVRRCDRRRPTSSVRSTPATRLVFVETIANPRTQVADLARIGALCASRGILYVVDNTMTSPALFRPKAVGAGLVVNALTKYIGGHGNALGGCITDTGLFDWTRFPNIADNYKAQKPALWGIQQIRKKGLRDWGGTLSAEQAHHISVGAETLALRMERTCANAQALADILAAHPKVRAVYYPGPRDAPAARAREATVRRRSADSSRSSSPTASTASNS